MALAPSEKLPRSFLYRELAGLGATFEAVNGYACAVRIGEDGTAEAQQARTLGICDHSALKRTGFKGWATAEWLRDQGVRLEDTPNRVYLQEDGARLARLSKGEFVVLGDLEGKSDLTDRLDAAWTMASATGCYRVPREDSSAWLKITGEHAASMFAKVCGVDLRPRKFPDHAIAQASLARMNAIVARGDIGGTLAFDLLFDLASAVYLWRALLGAMEEFGGRPVGLDAVRGLAGGGAPGAPSRELG